MNVYFSVRLIVFGVLIKALLGYLRKRFHAPYLRILCSSFHLDSLDLLPYFVSMVFSGFSRL